MATLETARLARTRTTAMLERLEAEMARTKTSWETACAKGADPKVRHSLVAQGQRQKAQRDELQAVVEGLDLLIKQLDPHHETPLVATVRDVAPATAPSSDPF
jgi:hypothetical protein